MPKAIAAASFRNGTLLDDLTRSNAEEQSRSDLASGHAPHGVTIAFCTVCSAGEVVVLVLMALQSFYKSMGVDCSFKHVYSCEIKKSVQDWIEGMFHELRIPNGCLFHNAEELGNGEGRCVRHNQTCSSMNGKRD